MNREESKLTIVDGRDGDRSMTIREQRIAMEIYATDGPKAAAEKFGVSADTIHQLAKRHGVKAAPRGDRGIALTAEEKEQLDISVYGEEPHKAKPRRRDACQDCPMLIDAGNNVGTVPCIFHCLLGRKAPP